jgi:hypothetical protein
VLNPDKLALRELWSDQVALNVHAMVNTTRAPLPPGLRAEGRSREDYPMLPDQLTRRGRPS